MKYRDIIKLLRIEQWYKNLLIYVPLIFSQNLMRKIFLIRTTIGFFALSLASSAIYIINDIRDVERDRLHPIKKFRPIASGKISIKLAFFYAISILLISLFLSFTLSFMFTVAIFFLFLLSMIYTLYLKNSAILDILLIAINYIIRSSSGALIIYVYISPWLIAGIFFTAIFLSLNKRKIELITLGDMAPRIRQVFNEYNMKNLDQMINIISTLIILTWTLYSIESRYPMLIITTPLIVYIIFRYLMLINLKKKQYNNPHDVVLKDKNLLISILIFVVMVIISIYFIRL